MVKLNAQINIAKAAIGSPQPPKNDIFSREKSLNDLTEICFTNSNETNQFLMFSSKLNTNNQSFFTQEVISLEINFSKTTTIYHHAEIFK